VLWSLLVSNRILTYSHCNILQIVRKRRSFIFNLPYGLPPVSHTIKYPINFMIQNNKNLKSTLSPFHFQLNVEKEEAVQKVQPPSQIFYLKAIVAFTAFFQPLYSSSRVPSSIDGSNCFSKFHCFLISLRSFQYPTARPAK